MDKLAACCILLTLQIFWAVGVNAQEMPPVGLQPISITDGSDLSTIVDHLHETGNRTDIDILEGHVTQMQNAALDRIHTWDGSALERYQGDAANALRLAAREVLGSAEFARQIFAPSASSETDEQWEEVTHEIKESVVFRVKESTDMFMEAYKTINAISQSMIPTEEQVTLPVEASPTTLPESLSIAVQ